MALIVGLLAATQVASAQTSPLDLGRLVSDQVAALATQLAGGSNYRDRELAARRLLSIGRSEARDAVAAAVANAADPAARLAAVRAIADDLPPDPRFVDPLLEIFASPQARPLTDAAGVALGNFKLSPEVARRLVSLTEPRQPEAVRVAATRALSAQVEKSAAERLARLTNDSSAAVSADAIDSLRSFTGLPLDSAESADGWWKTQADVPADRFRLETLAARASRSEQQARQGDETFQELRATTLAQLNGATGEKLGDALAKLLASPRDALRTIAVQQAAALAGTGDLPASVRPAVRSLLADPVPEVRIGAARVVYAINDSAAADAVVRQLAVESDPRARAELARALGPMGGTAAVAVLVPLLDDSSPAVVREAADALSKIGQSLAADSPLVAAEVAGRVKSLFGSRTNEASRAALLKVLVSLKQPALWQTYRDLLTGSTPQPEAIRRLAARGLGALGAPANVDLLVESLRDESPAVRQEVVRALAASNGGFTLIAPSLSRRLNPKVEPSAEVRAAAWDAMRGLFASATRDQLVSMPNWDVFKDDQAKRLVLFDAIAGKAQADVDRAQAAGDAAALKAARDNLSSALQQAGDTHRALAESSGDPAAAASHYGEATADYQRALVVSRAQGQAMVVEKLVESIVVSMLRGRDYAGAAKFATDLFATPDGKAYQGTVGYRFKEEAQRLAQETGRQDDAAKLIEIAVAMPTFPSRVRDELLEIRRDMVARQKQRNDRGEPFDFYGPRIAIALAGDVSPRSAAAIAP